MQSTLVLLSLGLCSALANAQFSIDKVLGTSAIGQVQAYVVSLNSNPAWTNNIATLESDLPASIAALVSADPPSYVELLATETSKPAYLTAVPSSVIQTLIALASDPLHAVSDIEAYATALYEDNEASRSAFSQLATLIPQSVQSAAIADPIAFLARIVFATANPDWVTDIPSSLQPQVASAINHALAIVQHDVPAPTPAAKARSVPRHAMPGANAATGPAGVMALPTATAPPPMVTTTTNSRAGSGAATVAPPAASGSPIAPFKGAAMNLRAATGFALGGGGALAAAAVLLFWGFVLL